MCCVLRLFTFAATLVAASFWLAAFPTNAKDESTTGVQVESTPKPPVRKLAMKAFMRKKLALSQDIMEGLALEDFKKIEEGARQLSAMSVAAEFMVVKEPLYADEAAEFRRTVNKMEKAAKELRLDAATLSFMDMTMSCVECHKYVRTIRIANIGQPEGTVGRSQASAD